MPANVVRKFLQRGTGHSGIHTLLHHVRHHNVLQFVDAHAFVQALVAGGRSLAGNCIGHRRADQCRDDESMTAGGLGNEHDRGQRSFIAGGNEGSHAGRGIEFDGVGVNNRLRESGSKAAASQKQRNEHGADAAAGKRKQSCRKLEDAEDHQFQAAVMPVQDEPDRFIVRPQRNQ